MNFEIQKVIGQTQSRIPRHSAHHHDIRDLSYKNIDRILLEDSERNTINKKETYFLKRCLRQVLILIILFDHLLNFHSLSSIGTPVHEPGNKWNRVTPRHIEVI